MIQGVPLSLNDIENIVVKNWNFPLVIYGFYLGPIGGPNLPKEAYTGKNVYRLLEENAIEFINSNRGFKANKGKLKASLLYEWWFGLFDNSLEGLLEHLRFYAEAPFDQGLDSVKKLDFDLFDWNIADIIGGSYYSGEHNNAASSLRINSDNVETTTSIFFFRDYFMGPGPGTSHYFGDLPPAAIVLLRGIAKNKSFPDQKEDDSAQ